MLVEEVSNQLWWCWCNSTSFILMAEDALLESPFSVAAAVAVVSAAPVASLDPSASATLAPFLLNLLLPPPPPPSSLFPWGLAGAVRESHAYGSSSSSKFSLSELVKESSLKSPECNPLNQADEL